MAQWDALVDGALASLAARRLLFNTRLIALAPPPPAPSETSFAGPGPWDRATVEIQVDRTSIQQWLAANGEVSSQEDDEASRELILFSGNDYMCLSSHPAVREAAVKVLTISFAIRTIAAAQEYGMGPRGSSLICGYTTYHKLVEESLAKLQKKEDCLLCPTGFSANTALMTALGSISSLLAAGRKPAEDERIAIFSDALNHASTIDGIRLVERQHQAVAFVYKHCDMSHLDFLLSSCPMEKKVVVTDRQAHGTLLCGENGGGIPELFGCEDDIDICVGSLSKGVGCQGGFIACSLFSMDGDFAPLPQLVKLRNKYGFLLVVDDAHGTLLCGENGGGIPELFGCEDDIDICVGSLSKGVGCQGGFIACRLRITLSSAHTSDDIRRLVDALAPWLPAQHAEQGCASVSRL
ncbi:8-amino-7-oxononanoate synthase [Triticum urartu]|uniref:8-amino-7-oxononanoate synthase n=1 Tax=Triticum urartu TaxID=4572 RepID=M8A5J8_TRIUA|nr:8-amino-7-oxononanoate synthase [Triticum urartu]